MDVDFVRDDYIRCLCGAPTTGTLCIDGVSVQRWCEPCGVRVARQLHDVSYVDLPLYMRQLLEQHASGNVYKG